MNSVNTNLGAMVALQNLSATQSSLATTQNRISTGLKVGSAKDNGAIWAIAQTQRGESQALNAVKDSLQRGQSVLDVTMAAGDQIVDVLNQMKEKVTAARDVNIDSATRTKLNDEYKSLFNQIGNIVKSATFNGSTLIDANNATGYADIKALGSADATITVDVSKTDLTTGGANVSVTNGAWATAAAADTEAANVDNSITAVTNAMSAFGVGAKALDRQLGFVGKLQNALDAGVGNMVDADLAKESANLQALQTKQQLGVQALSISNQSSSILLGLFR
jgi:flagellin